MLHEVNPLIPKVTLTSGVKRNFMPSTDPFRVSPLIKKIVRTKYGSVEVTYTAYTKETLYSDHVKVFASETLFD